MTIANDRGKTYPINWCSAAVSPGELWISLAYDGRIADIAGDFEGVEAFVVARGEAQVRHEGYTRLTNAMIDTAGKELTLRVRRVA